ncbi:hypothetical protein [Nocardia sp. NPDC050793]|uniref:hypothetical protein n=1 Tax=Nocardia sp. NPDC050793 TaxID=3155159 RepID=UPI0033DBEDFA
MSPVEQAQRPPCAAVPDCWDLDIGSPASWRIAVQTCGTCPLLAKCHQLAESLTERGQAPRAMIWAGIGYDNSGNVVENLDRYRVASNEHRRLLRIVRNGERRPRADVAADIPRRHIVLGRGLKPTGT